jgi:hypothetical protein
MFPFFIKSKTTIGNLFSRHKAKAAASATASDLDNFKEQCDLGHVLFAGEIELLLYKRFRVVGRV